MKAGSTTSHDHGRPVGAGRPTVTGESTISALGTLIFWVLTAYLLILFARMIIGWIMVLGNYRPAKSMVAVFEVVYTLTDPPLRFLGRFIPPLRLGSVSLDLGFLLLVIVIIVLQGQAQRL